MVVIVYVFIRSAISILDGEPKNESSRHSLYLCVLPTVEPLAFGVAMAMIIMCLEVDKCNAGVAAGEVSLSHCGESSFLVLIHRNRR